MRRFNIHERARFRWDLERSIPSPWPPLEDRFFLRFEVRITRCSSATLSESEQLRNALTTGYFFQARINGVAQFASDTDHFVSTGGRAANAKDGVTLF